MMKHELREEIVRLACQYGRYGYRRITALLNETGMENQSQTG